MGAFEGGSSRSAKADHGVRLAPSWVDPKERSVFQKRRVVQKQREREREREKRTRSAKVKDR